MTRKHSSFGLRKNKQRVGPNYKVSAGKRRTRRLWVRVAIWSVAALLLTVGGIALGSYLWLDAKVSAANDRMDVGAMQILDENEQLEENAVSSPPESVDILLVGSDERPGDTRDGTRSDVVMLVHVDRANDYLSMLSLPRDLHVEVEGHGSRKLNYAYAVGGAELLIKTVQQVTGVYIDHLVEVDFKAFMDMTDSLGGVYLEVDRYYTKVDLSPEFDRTIEGVLEPGYQLLDGLHALGYVRYRYDANADFGRMARQQRFITALRQQAMGWDLGLKLPGLISGLLDNTATDLETNELISLATWGIGIDSNRIRQVVLRGMNQMSGGVTFVFCTDEDIKDAVAALLDSTTDLEVAQQSTTTTQPSTASSQPSTAGTQPSTAGTQPSTATTSVAAPTTTTKPAGDSPTMAAVYDGENQTAWKTSANNVPFVVLAPNHVAKDFRMYPVVRSSYARVYDIQVGGDSYPALVMLYRNTKTGKAGEVKLQDEYINVTETTWLDAPVASPGTVIEQGGIAYTIVSNAGEVERIWWKKGGVLYWVSNSLSRVASKDELLAMAESMAPVYPQ